MDARVDERVDAERRPRNAGEVASRAHGDGGLAPCVLDQQSGARRALEVLGDKWAVLAVYALEGGTKRFNQLERELIGVTPKMLAETLRKLERAGLLARTVYPEVPPRVEYALTALGTSLRPVTAALCAWADAHAAALWPAAGETTPTTQTTAGDPHDARPYAGA